MNSVQTVINEYIDHQQAEASTNIQRKKKKDINSVKDK